MSLLFLIALISGCALAYVEYNIDEAEALFEKFIIDFDRNYKNEQEKQMRFNIFKKSLHEINERNRQHNENVMGINQFSDLTKEEIKRNYLGYKPAKNGACEHGVAITIKATPENFDWREHGVVTNVKHQQGCGSCWAFSTVGNIESQYAIKHGPQSLVNLSEQQLVDCDTTNGGCQGGWMTVAMEYLKKNGGLMSEQDYPYQAVHGQCQFDSAKAKVNVTDCQIYHGLNDEDIKNVLIQKGPLTVALASTPFVYYQNGVVQHCKLDDPIDHALLVVGYGTDKQTKLPYWIIKNSWGPQWGENGYLRMVRGNPNCRWDELATAVVA